MQLKDEVESLIKEGYLTEMVAKEVKKYREEHLKRKKGRGLGYEKKEKMDNDKFVRAKSIHIIYL